MARPRVKGGVCFLCGSTAVPQGHPAAAADLADQVGAVKGFRCQGNQLYTAAGGVKQGVPFLHGARANVVAVLSAFFGRGNKRPLQVHAQQAGASLLAHIVTGGDKNIRQLFSGQGHGGTAKGGDPALSQGGADPIHTAYRAVGKITAPAAVYVNVYKARQQSVTLHIPTLLLQHTDGGNAAVFHLNIRHIFLEHFVIKGHILKNHSAFSLAISAASFASSSKWLIWQMRRRNPAPPRSPLV